MIWDLLSETVIDTLKMLPFLFLVYLAMEFLEDAEDKTAAIVRKSGRLGPLIGSALGVIPQCGFSAATANLYAGGVITRGTMLAVFLSTSDEMLPILLSGGAPASLILKILAFKLLAGLLAGMLVDLVTRRLGRSRSRDIHELCEQEHCRCEDGVWKSALRHTLKITAFLFVSSFIIGFIVESIGAERFAGFVLNRPVVGELLAGLIGLIPNCAASVIITQLYLGGGMSAGAMMSGLLVGAGVGMLVLFRMNRDVKDNLFTLALLYLLGVVFGLIASVLRIF